MNPITAMISIEASTAALEAAGTRPLVFRFFEQLADEFASDDYSVTAGNHFKAVPDLRVAAGSFRTGKCLPDQIGDDLPDGELGLQRDLRSRFQHVSVDIQRRFHLGSLAYRASKPIFDTKEESI
jgi:hypothetical protein